MGPSPDEEKISFLEDYIERTKKVLDEVYALAREYETELDYKPSITDEDGFDMAISGLEIMRTDFEAHIRRLEPEDEYDDPRL
jgi:hypothetical protein